MRTREMNRVTISESQRCYVVPCGRDGYTTLGWDVAERRRVALRAWRGCESLSAPEPGTLAHYHAYRHEMTLASNHADATHSRCEVELSPQLVGFEGRRVEVIDEAGERRRFRVGKSTGWLPIHLELHNSRSRGGIPAAQHYRSVQVVE